MLNHTSFIPVNADLVSSANKKTIEMVLQLANDFSQYLKFYWLRHNIEFDPDLSEFPSVFKLNFSTLQPERKLNDAKVNKFYDLQRSFTSFAQETSFYVERSDGEIKHRIDEVGRFYEIFNDLLESKDTDYSLLLNKFFLMVQEYKDSNRLFAPTPVSSSSTFTEYFRQGLTQVISAAGMSYACSLERVFTIFKSEANLPSDKKDYFLNIILPINTDQFHAGESASVQEIKTKSEDSEVNKAEFIVIPGINSDKSTLEKTFLTRTKDILGSIAGTPAMRLQMPTMSTVALASLAAFTAAGIYAYRNDRTPGMFNLFRSSESGSNSAGAVSELAKPVAEVATVTVKKAVIPAIQAVVPRATAR